MEAKAKINVTWLNLKVFIARRKPLKKKKTTYGKEENICKWHDQQCINFQNILIGFKVNLKRFSTPRLRSKLLCLRKTSGGCWLWSLIELLHIMISCAYTHTHTHTLKQKCHKKNYYCSVLWYFLWCQFYSTSYKRQNDDHSAQN